MRPESLPPTPVPGPPPTGPLQPIPAFRTADEHRPAAQEKRERRRREAPPDEHLPSPKKRRGVPHTEPPAAWRGGRRGECIPSRGIQMVALGVRVREAGVTWDVSLGCGTSWLHDVGHAWLKADPSIQPSQGRRGPAHTSPHRTPRRGGGGVAEDRSHRAAGERYYSIPWHLSVRE
ncbi:unnamed protein product [Pleuronectes platessa]|uniref:Uncharacterized protein n=1 Tax=Pleuronectes platessa TaxID=8262 RepID=A0A9N7VUK1_PLEPL|nr:unnamed protein product [Pleuronectes platessa]